MKKKCYRKLIFLLFFLSLLKQLKMRKIIKQEILVAKIKSRINLNQLYFSLNLYKHKK